MTELNKYIEKKKPHLEKSVQTEYVMVFRTRIVTAKTDLEGSTRVSYSSVLFLYDIDYVLDKKDVNKILRFSTCLLRSFKNSTCIIHLQNIFLIYTTLCEYDTILKSNFI